MTKRQANTIIGGIVAILLLQVLIGFAILRGQANARQERASAKSAHEAKD